jgi:hypothetical protein
VVVTTSCGAVGGQPCFEGLLEHPRLGGFLDAGCGHAGAEAVCAASVGEGSAERSGVRQRGGGGTPDVNRHRGAPAGEVTVVEEDALEDGLGTRFHQRRPPDDVMPISLFAQHLGIDDVRPPADGGHRSAPVSQLRSDELGTHRARQRVEGMVVQPYDV